MSAEYEVTDWGVRYGDGEVETCGDMQADVEVFIASIRGQIESGELDADDYEPMTAVRRSRIIRDDILGEWEARA